MTQSPFHKTLLMILVALCVLVSCSKGSDSPSPVNPSPSPSPNPTPNTTVSVESVSLNKNVLELSPGTSASLTASVLPSDATNKNVEWSSSDMSVATVYSDGLVTAVREGTAVITVRTVDGGKTSTCSVTVKKRNEVYFYDNSFKQYCVTHFDKDSNGEISIEEAQAVTEISYSASSMYIYGIQHFENLRTLILHSGSEDLDDGVWHYISDFDHFDQIANLVKLVHLEINFFSIYSVPWLERMPDLEYLDLSNCMLNSLDVSSNPKLSFLDCSPMGGSGWNSLSSLFVSEGQTIPNVTVNRNSDYVPDNTIIYTHGSTKPGDNEGTDEGEEI